MDRLIKSRIAHDNGDVQYTMADGAVVTMNKHGDGFWRRVLDKLWEYEQGELARNLHDVASNQQVTNPLWHKGFCDFSEELATKNQVTSNKKSNWISVNERLPDLIPCNGGTAYSEAVIVWTDGKKAMIAVWDGIDFLCPFDYWEAWGENITHWMPLPTPPKEGKP